MLPEPGEGWRRLETESAESNGGDNLRFGSATIRWNVFTKIDKMDSNNFVEMSFIVVEAIRWRCASFMSLPATVSEIFGGQTTPSILVVQIDEHCMARCMSYSSTRVWKKIPHKWLLYLSWDYVIPLCSLPSHITSKRTSWASKFAKGVDPWLDLTRSPGYLWCG